MKTFVSGEVMNGQFRIMMKRVAKRAGVSGWAQPLVDGRIEAILKGDRDAVEEVLGELEEPSLNGRTRRRDREDGLVDEIETSVIDPSEVEAQSFKIKHGARVTPSDKGMEITECNAVEKKGKDWYRCRVYGYEPLEPRHCQDCNRPDDG